MCLSTSEAVPGASLVLTSVPSRSSSENPCSLFFILRAMTRLLVIRNIPHASCGKEGERGGVQVKLKEAFPSVSCLVAKPHEAVDSVTS